MRKHIRFIINPVSGTRKRLKHKLPGLIGGHLDHKVFSYDIKWTDSPGHARKLAQEAVEENIPIVAIAGGDGTVNEVSSVLMHKPVALAILPMGSGNGLARHMEYPMSIKGALEVINRQKTGMIDLCKQGNTIFCSNAGMGFDAYVAKLFDQSRQRGRLGYTLASLKAFFTFRTFKFSIDTGELKLKGRGFLITICNSNQYGYNFKIAPKASLQDGLIDVFIVRKFPKWKIFHLIRSIIRGKTSNYIVNIKVSKLSIKTRKKVPFQIDGEPVKKRKRVEVEVLPKALKMVMP